ncbi:hypothetical protein B0T16DRAFT_409532 [Cercophora newfieldiana]|uniref:Tat pathway signal sequence n=1 Tax=Cercophora newfieldiana TaxID=92897 RepID=A0AA40CS13_9PEZI|nr:hypothetical protein B0T16DRAFT_409532 [Cercophora newfieldiana]
MPAKGKKKSLSWGRNSVQYQPVENLTGADDAAEQQPLNASSSETSLDDGNREFDNPRNKSLTRRLRWLAYTVLVITTNLMSLFLGFMVGRWNLNLDRTCAAYTTQYSPVLRDVDIMYEDQAFNGSFIKENIYRLEGSPEVDAAWEALGVDYRAGIISYEEGLKSGLTSSHVQRSNEFGGGFFVNVEGLHHLHCLNLVRKALYFNYDYYKEQGTHAFTNDDKILRLHVTHCLDTVRQVLMCNVDTAVLGQVWYNPEHPKAFPDFSTKHKCKNYDAVRKWAEAREEPPPETLPHGYMKLPVSRDILPETP